MWKALAAGATPQSLPADVDSNVNADFSNADPPSNEHDNGATNADLSSGEHGDNASNAGSPSEWKSDDGSHADLLSNEQSDDVEIDDADFMWRVETISFSKISLKKLSKASTSTASKLDTICSLQL